MVKLLSITFITLILTGCATIFKSYKSEIDGIYIPKNLPEALSVIDKFYSDSIKSQIKLLNEDEFVGEFHMSTGLWMRNNLALWSGSRLSRYFKRKGIKHPDDMSGIILTSYHRQLTGKEVLLKSQIAAYKDYWTNAKKLSRLTRLPKKSKHPDDSLSFGEAKWYGKNSYNSLLHFQTNSKTDSIWIYDYLYGWAKIHNEMKTKLSNSNNTDSLLSVIYSN